MVSGHCTRHHKNRKPTASGRPPMPTPLREKNVIGGSSGPPRSIFFWIDRSHLVNLCCQVTVPDSQKPLADAHRRFVGGRCPHLPPFCHSLFFSCHSREGGNPCIFQPNCLCIRTHSPSKTRDLRQAVGCRKIYETHRKR